MKIQPVGDTAVKLSFSGKASVEMNRMIRQFCEELDAASITGLIEWVPAFDSVTIYYDPWQVGYEEFKGRMEEIAGKDLSGTRSMSRVVHIPVLYGGEAGPDLHRVAEHNRLKPEEVIRIHQHPEYLVYMLGFLPGFPYLGGLDQRIAAPRLPEPRPRIEPGSVGIAHEQTGVYPLESPGGWNLIGKTPLRLFDKQKGEEGFLFQAGDRVKFLSVSEQDFKQIEEQVEHGIYEVYSGG
ncbi:5-oxoprolinase subunit PxpB [Virgibacillus sediminis]|uniref:5-oxoprolinase subunit PxpB n=1 Tax=Virgibacillus sediminis TaxID=202260 RepID=A0ABV7A2P2_9BACI